MREPVLLVVEDAAVVQLLEAAEEVGRVLGRVVARCPRGPRRRRPRRRRLPLRRARTQAADRVRVDACALQPLAVLLDADARCGKR